MIPCNGTHGTKQPINNKSIQEEYKIWVLVAEACMWLCSSVQTGAKKGKQVAPSTKWGFGENVVLRLLTFSFDVFMDNYLTSFRLLTHLGVNNIRATGVLNKNMIRKCTIFRDKQRQKK